MRVRLPAVDPPESLSDRHVGLTASVFADLGVEPGDVVGVSGDRRTAAVVERVDGERGGIRLSKSIRRNAGVDRGDTVVVEPTDVSVASTLTLRLEQAVDVTRVADALRRRLGGTAVSIGDEIEATLLGGALALTFVVDAIEPSSPAIVGDRTEVVVVDPDTADVVDDPPPRDADHVVPAATYRRLHGAVSTRLDAADAFEGAGLSATLGLLLHGPRGSGKTTLVETVAAAVDATLVRTSATDLRDASAGDRGERLDRVVGAASDADRAVVLLDDLEVLAADGGSASTIGDRLRTTLDDLRATEGTVVVGVTADVGSVPDALRRGGRFDREIAVEPLDIDERRAALEAISRDVPFGAAADLDGVATRLNGFVLADVAALIDVAFERAVRRDGRTAVGQSDLDHAIDAVEPSGLRDVAVEFPSVAWDDVGGLEAAKREVVRTVYWPLEYAEYLERVGVEPPSGVLLHGPPGTGKTLLARAAASLSDANFISVNGPELLDRYVGASEQAVRDLFATARENAPAVVFFDEVDAISPKRRGDDTGAGERVVSQLLTELDGLEPLTDVVVVAATNRPDVIDEALLRPGRIEKTVETPLPDEPARREILRIHARDTPTATSVDFDALAARTAGYSGGDLAALVREAAMLAIEGSITDEGRNGDLTVDVDHFERAVAETTPSVSDAPEGDGAFQW